jgi:hypothetical protein
MTHDEIKELRKWSAKLVDKVIDNPESPFWLQRFTDGQLVADWAPDLDSSPVWQILVVIAALEKKYKHISWVIDSDNDNILDGHPKIRVEVAMIIDNIVRAGEQYVSNPKEIFTAFLKAAYEAMKAGKGESK